MDEFLLSPVEARQAEQVCVSLAQQYDSSDSVELLRYAAAHAHELPLRIRQRLCEARFDRRFGGLLIRGHVVDDYKVGKTPAVWKQPDAVQRSLPLEILTLLHGSLIGEAFGWLTQQDGHIVNDLVPIREFESAQVGAGSGVELAWHTEDAFHPRKAHYLVLMCVRNPDEVATSLATIDAALPDPSVAPELFRPCVSIRPDDAHLAGLGALEQRGALDPRKGKPSWLSPTPRPVLTGRLDQPELCIDPAYMDTLPGDPHGARAVANICDALEAKLVDIVLEPGDVLIINNRRAVHGRRSFAARYDGSDRWLKRVNIARSFDDKYSVGGHPRVIV